MNDNIQPFIKWQGGKTRLKMEIIKHFSKYNIYVEPFIGSGAILFYIRPKNAIISDINTNLINVYIIIRDKKDNLIKLLKKYQKEYLPKNDEDRKIYYYEKRNIYNKIKFYKNTDIMKESYDIKIKCAAVFIFLNKTGFNGLYRENKKQKYNVPIGRYKNPCIYKENILNDVSKYLNDNNITILYGHYKKIYTYIEKEKINIKSTFIYMDPPYYPLKATSFTSYCGEKFEYKEHLELRDFCNLLLCSFCLSNSYCETIKELYKDYNITTVYIKRTGGGIKNNIAKIKECIITVLN